MIEVEVRLYAKLSPYSSEKGIGKPLILQMPKGTRLIDLMFRLSIPESEVGTAFINNRHEDNEYLLRDGDRVALFSPVAGG